MKKLLCLLAVVTFVSAAVCPSTGAASLLYLKQYEPYARHDLDATATEGWTNANSPGNQNVEIQEWKKAGYTVQAMNLCRTIITPSLLADYDVLRINTYQWCVCPFTADEVSAVHDWVVSGGKFLADIGISEHVDMIQPFGVDRIEGTNDACGYSEDFCGTPWTFGPVTGPNGTVDSFAGEGMHRVYLSSGHSLTVDATVGDGYPAVVHGEFGAGKVVIVFVLGWSHSQAYPDNLYRADITQGDNLQFLRNVIGHFEGEISPAQLSYISLDIKPGLCPNPLNTDAPGPGTWEADDVSSSAAKVEPRVRMDLEPEHPILPAAILVGTACSVWDIDASTVMLEGVPARYWTYGDVSTPVSEDAEECECNALGGDKFLDVLLEFDISQLAEALGEVHDGDIVPLTVTGELFDGTPFEATDCVVIVKGGSEAGEWASAETPLNLGNYPNPFNPVTQITFSLPRSSHARLDIFNIMGGKVTTLVDGELEARDYAIQWDGKDTNGRQVATGVYFYRLDAGEFVDTKRMILLK